MSTDFLVSIAKQRKQEIRTQHSGVENGEMVAVVDGDMQSIMCRRFQAHNNEVLLLPYNQGYDPIVYDANTLKIIGKVVSVTKAIK